MMSYREALSHVADPAKRNTLTLAKLHKVKSLRDLIRALRFGSGPFGDDFVGIPAPRRD